MGGATVLKVGVHPAREKKFSDTHLLYTWGTWNRTLRSFISVIVTSKHLAYLQQMKLERKYSLESTDPRESEIRAHLRP